MGRRERNLVDSSRLVAEGKWSYCTDPLTADPLAMLFRDRHLRWHYADGGSLYLFDFGTSCRRKCMSIVISAQLGCRSQKLKPSKF